MTDEGPAYEITPDDDRTWHWACRRCGYRSASVTLVYAAENADRHVSVEHPALPPIPTDEGTVIRHKDSGSLYQRRGAWWVRVANSATAFNTPPSRAYYDVAEWS